MVGIDEAAAALQADMNRGGTHPEKPKNAPQERIFVNSQQPDVDSGPAGGDDEPDPGVRDVAEATEEGSDIPRDPEDEEEESEESGSEQDEDGEEGEGEGDTVYAVMVDGEEKQVPLKEALEGYIRTETFHKRLSQVMEARQIVSREAAALSQDRQQVAQRIAALEEQYASLIPTEPDWDALYAQNPQEARKLQKQYDDFNQKRYNLQMERDRVLKEDFEANQRRLVTYASQERMRFEASNPRWASDKKAQARDLESMRSTAMQHGFTEEEISQVYDSRMLSVLLKAAKYDRLMKAKPRPVPNSSGKGPKPMKPGAGNTRTAQRGFVAAQKRLSRSGSIDDAAAVFQNILRR